MKRVLKYAIGISCSVLMYSASAFDGNPFLKNQIWKGTYTCDQGETELTLRIKSASPTPHNTDLGDAYTVEAVFDFDYNNRAAAGAFYLTGNYYPESNIATFDPGKWIRQPPGYVTVGMDGKVSQDAKTYEGKILFQGCRSFQLKLK